MADRISMLPDDILCHILSFLPTKIVVTTSLLSKRWNPLWLSVPTLDFEYSNFEYSNKFNKFVERGYIRYNNFIDSVISSLNVKQSIIKRFRLTSLGLRDHSNVDKLVNAVVQNGLEHFHLNLSKGGYRVPYTVFSCRTLVVLKLRCIHVKTVSSVNLPSLKILKLNNIEFFEGQYLKEILSACPVLEYLKIEQLSSVFGSLPMENISENVLPRLVRADICQFDTPPPLKAVCNVQFLRLYQLMQVEFSRYNDIPVFQNLTELDLIIIENFSCHWVVELLNHCPKLQILHAIDGTEVGDIYEENWSYPQKHVPECLSLHLKTCTLKLYYGLEGGAFTFARYIIQNARVLQTMAIYSVLMNDKEKLEISKKISLCPTSSATCQLLVEPLQVEDF